jgi:hypothetical protein
MPCAAMLLLSLSFYCFLIKGLALLLSYSVTQQPGIILQTIIQITYEQVIHICDV